MRHGIMFSKYVNYIYRHFIVPFADLLYPPFCRLCDAELPVGITVVCIDCIDRLTIFPDNANDLVSGADNTIVLYEFEENIRQLIHWFKYDQCKSLAISFARAARARLQQYNSTDYSLITSVPLHPSRQRERGYNQSEEIVRALCRELDQSYQTNPIRRIKNTPSQTTLNRSERKTNVSGAFICDADLKGQKILLIDDVVTTGSTTSACCTVLRAAGAESVDVLALANPKLSEY